MKRKSAEKKEPGLDLVIETAGDSPRTPLTVTALTSAIRDVLEKGLGEVWVAGEISNFRAPGSGHLYFTLKDATATLAAVMFRTEAGRVGFPLKDGQAILARGTVTVYEARGQYQLQVAEVQARGQGGLQQRFDELKHKLQTEGLFDAGRKRVLPIFPETVAIVTSLQGAVLQDMLRILQRRAPGIRLLIRGVRVQGVGAAQEIADAIDAFSQDGWADLLVVARGGGSLEDLWCFNEEVVARALAACVLPTISAVGHETDFTIADFVADLRAPTPSAAAEVLTREWSDWRATVQTLSRRLERNTRQALLVNRQHLARLSSSYALREPRRVVHEWAQRLDDLRQAVALAASRGLLARHNLLRLRESQLQAHHPARALAGRRALLEHLAARLRSLGPQATLDRGYALLIDRTGHPIRRADPALEGQSAQIALGRGALEIKITKAHPDENLVRTLNKPDDAPAPSKKSRPPRGKPASGPAGPAS